MQGPEILLIRHAESEWNALGRWQGHADPPLSARGREQADALAAELAATPIDVLHCSDLRRARETAQPLCQTRDLEPELSAVYRELDIGAWEGLLRAEIEARDGALLRDFDSEDPWVRPPDGETRGELRARARGALLGLASLPEASCIAVVCHLGFIRALDPSCEPANAGFYRARAGELLLRSAAGDARRVADAAL